MIFPLSCRSFCLNKVLLSGVSVSLLFAFCSYGAPTTPPLASITGTQEILLLAIDGGESIQRSGWKMNALEIEPAKVAAKFGKSALTFRGVAEETGSKGDFSLAVDAPETCKSLSLWVYGASNSNVASVGLQVRDSEDESLLMQVPIDWDGWKEVEFDLSEVSATQTWPQLDKNKKIDLPLKGVNIVWFAQSAGPSSLTVDKLVASIEANKNPVLPVEGKWSNPTVGEVGQAMTGDLLLTNFTGSAITPTITYSVQQDPSLYSQKPIDPIYGRDHALGATSWTEEKGKRIEEGSLTDGKEWIGASVPWGQHTEALQFVDLGIARRITHLTLGPADGNWLWKIDVAASLDGKAYVPVPSLQGVNLHGQWGSHTLPLAAPFQARYLRLRHHNDGQTVNSISMPSSLSAYDGISDEKWELPKVGEIVSQGTLSPSVPAHSFSSVALKTDKPLAPGAYLVAFKVSSGQHNQLSYAHYFVKPSALATISPDSRFGLNAAQVEFAPQHRRLGVGWVRFENFKWPMISPEPGVFKYDGSVGPWNVPHDSVVEGYAKEGINVLPFLFETPKYASSAPATVDRGRWQAYPPNDNQQYGEFAFQTASRYGAKKRSEEELKTPDKKSGLNQVHVYELWNEPNLTDPGWGPWVGTTAQYLEMFRVGAEAIKRADSTAKVTNGGLAGIDINTLEPLRTYHYADGKKPLDFVDILNVHYYSGRMAPETATVDGNADRSGAVLGAHTFEDDLHRLVDWRNRNKTGTPIWMTETGYDSAGPFGTDEYTQAARLPRVIMMMLGAGVDKVFVYRESGSTPSMHAASGLFRNDGSYKPSWFTYATLIRQLDQMTNGQRLPYADSNVHLYAWKHGNKTTLSAWTVNGTGNLDLKLGNCQVTDAFGHAVQRNLTGQTGLSIFPIYISNISNLTPVQQLSKTATESEAKRQVENKRLAQTRAYLFDFGSQDRVGSIELGEPRSFTPVLAKEVYEEAKGYGFAAPAMSDEVSGWINDPLERDAVRVGPGTQFRIKAKPGRYLLRLSISPLSPNAATIKIQNGISDKAVSVSQDNTTGEVSIEVGEQAVIISIDTYAMLRWISMIRQ